MKSTSDDEGEEAGGRRACLRLHSMPCLCISALPPLNGGGDKPLSRIILYICLVSRALINTSSNITIYLFFGYIISILALEERNNADIDDININITLFSDVGMT